MPQGVRTLTHPAPPLPPPQVPSRALVLGGLKAKRDVRASKKWEWKPFVSSHRRDLSLSHWARADAEASDYAFAKFNRRIDVLRYTPEEYVRTCSPSPTSTDPADVDLRWQEGATPEAFAAGQSATDALFELVRRFDMRWPVIADRCPSSWGYKTVEVSFPPPRCGRWEWGWGGGVNRGRCSPPPSSPRRSCSSGFSSSPPASPTSA